jgi:hypothetical protein
MFHYFVSYFNGNYRWSLEFAHFISRCAKLIAWIALDYQKWHIKLSFGKVETTLLWLLNAQITHIVACFPYSVLVCSIYLSFWCTANAFWHYIVLCQQIIHFGALSVNFEDYLVLSLNFHYILHAIRVWNLDLHLNSYLEIHTSLHLNLHWTRRYNAHATRICTSYIDK